MATPNNQLGLARSAWAAKGWSGLENYLILTLTAHTAWVETRELGSSNLSNSLCGQLYHQEACEQVLVWSPEARLFCLPTLSLHTYVQNCAAKMMASKVDNGSNFDISLHSYAITWCQNQVGVVMSVPSGYALVLVLVLVVDRSLYGNDNHWVNSCLATHSYLGCVCLSAVTFSVMWSGL